MSGLDNPSTFDHGSEDLMRDPYPTYETFRTRCPLAHSDNHGGFYVVSRYDDVKRVFSDFKNFSSKDGGAIPSQPLTMYPIDLDPPRQTKFRRLLNPLFTPEAVEHEAGRILAIIDDLIDGFIERGEAEFGAELVRPILPAVVLPMIGVPENSHKQVVADIDCLTRRHRHTAEEIGAAFMGLTETLLALIAERRSQPARDDVIGTLLRSRVDDVALTDDDIFRTVMIVLFGGLDTTTSVMLEALYLIGRNRDLKAELQASDDWTVAIEELVRFASPIQGLRRTVAVDTDLGDGQVAAGDAVFALLGSANRDPAVFAEPDRCMLTRSDNPHLSFGAGAHICLGRNLARLELRILLRRMFERLPDFTVHQDFRPEYLAGEARGMKALPARFKPGRRLGSEPARPN